MAAMTSLPLVKGRVPGRRAAPPRAFDTPEDAEGGPQAERLRDLRARFGHLGAEALLDKMIRDAFPGRIAVVSSFGSESVVLLHLVARIDPSTPVLFLNTGKLFPETLRYRDRLQDALGLTDLRALHPHPEDERTLDPDGVLWNANPDACCEFRKVLPLRRALKSFDAQITGRKRFQTGARKAMQTIELSEGKFKINPLADWSLERLAAWIDGHKLPKHPLVRDGYPSIGCMPCTERVQPGDDYRSGRWAGFGKDECGLHTDGGGI
ncbi:MAG: phosphoadenylyl-sulfate reductase [Alphaproteobacteria bacterium]